MKSLEQNYRKGTLEVVDVPHPKAAAGRVIVRTVASLASVGTEKAMVELARKSLVGKARARPDLVKQVLDKARTDGLLETWRQVMGRLETPIQLGYSSAGTVIEVGPGVDGFRTGDRVACTGSGYAGHAEVVSVPAKLCVQVPDDVDFQSASFVALGGIALESVRMAGVELGSRVVVIGLGLLGQIAVQILNAAGAHVFGIDVDSEKAALAASHGAERTAVAGSGTSVTETVSAWTGGNGADAVIIMASTEGNEPLQQASEMCRERARIVATGMVGLDVPRREFYDKELELVVSRAWGPGLYDPRYTGGAVDYPLPYARWTAERNAQEFLSQLSRGAVSVDHLVSHRFPIEDAAQAYEMILEGGESYLGVVLTYTAGPVESGEASSAIADARPVAGMEEPSLSKVWLNG
ncbi:MAG: zinc-binding alcohol dehydrogenase, partial [Chloroflexi bacterium]|nr:zinc-binding alcohol dehydrogenase [Chloroflexota bacterium]